MKVAYAAWMERFAALLTIPAGEAIRHWGTHFLTITQHDWAGLCHTCEVAQLPRTNNDLEHLFRSSLGAAHHRTQGRQSQFDRAWLGTGEGGGPHLAAAPFAAAVRPSRSGLVARRAPTSRPTPPRARPAVAVSPASRGVSGDIGEAACQAKFASIDTIEKIARL